MNSGSEQGVLHWVEVTRALPRGLCSTNTECVLQQPRLERKQLALTGTF